MYRWCIYLWMNIYLFSGTETLKIFSAPLWILAATEAQLCCILSNFSNNTLYCISYCQINQTWNIILIQPVVRRHYLQEESTRLHAFLLGRQRALDLRWVFCCCCSFALIHHPPSRFSITQGKARSDLPAWFLDSWKFAFFQKPLCSESKNTHYIHIYTHNTG